MSLFKKNPSTASQPQPVRPHYLKVSPYENPEVTLELMGKICAAQPKVGANDFYKVYAQAVERELGRVDALPYCFYNTDMFEEVYDLWERLTSIQQTIATTLTEQGHKQADYTYVVVAGGYSSGKSSFLNNLVQQKSLLPTGTQPVSVVNTCLYCDRQAHTTTVQGINLRQATVELEPGVLQAIQHAEDSEVYLASVLNKLFVTIPSKGLHGLAFIDTPGYNNGLSANAFNGKTDEETAREAYQQGDVLFWFIDSDKGTVNTEDLNKIKEFQGKKAIIFTKADKKGKKESRNIVEAAYAVLSKHIGTNDLLDVMAYSALDNKVYYAYRYRTFDALIAAVRKVPKTGGDRIKQLQESYATCFNNLIAKYTKEAQQLDKRLRMLAKKKALCYSALQERKERSNSALIDKSRYTSCYKSLVEEFDRLVEAQKEGVQMLKQMLKPPVVSVGIFEEMNTDDLKRRLDESVQDIIAQAESRLQKQRCADAEAEYEQIKQRQTELLEAHKNCEKILPTLQNFKRVYIQALDMAIRTYYKQDVATQVEVVKQSYDVFESIKSRRYKAFLRSFEFGVELSLCNTEGFTPLTYAAHYGNDAMVDFLLQHDADCAGVDKRGYNALHTALLAGHKGICERLLSHSPSLKNTSACPNGEHKPINQLIEESQFLQWAKETFAPKT